MKHILGILPLLGLALCATYFLLVKTPVTPQLSTSKLTRDEFITLRKQLESQVASSNPQTALTQLSALMATNPAVLRSCHALAHAIGHASFDRYHSLPQALAYQSDICGNGYLHGSIEQYLSTIPDIEPIISSVCPSDDGSCLHGLGHGFMFYTSNNLPQSLTYCGRQLTPSAQTRCSEGVFMENFTTDQKLHPSAYLNATNPTYICQEQLFIPYKSVCYFYAPQYYLEIHSDNYSQALNWCLSQTPYTSECTRGVGSRLIKYNLKNISFVESTCSSSPSPSDCISGAISYYRTNFATDAKGLDFCSQLTTLKETCLHLL